MTTLQTVLMCLLCWFVLAGVVTVIWAVTLNVSKAKRNVGLHRSTADNCIHYSGDNGFVDWGSCPLCRPKTYRQSHA